MIRYSNDEGVIKFRGIRFRENQEKIILPSVGVGVFSKELFNDVVEKYNCKEDGNVEIDKKKEVMNLALSLAIKIK